MDTLIAVLVIFGTFLYFWSQYGKEWRRRFWLWLAEINPYYKVAQQVSLTSSALRKYANEALIKKVMELEAQVRRLESQLSDIEQKATASKDFQEEVASQEMEKIKEVLSLPPILKPTSDDAPIKVYDADGVFRGWLDSVRGTFSEAYILVRTPKNELLIFGPDELENLLLNEQTFTEQVRSGVLMIAYDRYNNKISPAYVRVTV